MTDSSIDNKFEIDKLLKSSWQLRDREDFKKFFDFISKFNHYSHYNTMLVYIQNPEVTFFGGKSFWKQKFNRTISKDAKPHIILAPQGPVMLVYDIFDTIGEQTPKDLLDEGFGGNPFEVEGKIHERTYNYTITEAEKWGIKICYKPMSYFKAGYVITLLTGGPEIYLKENESKEINFSTLIHELAHIFLGHTGIAQIKRTEKEKSNNIKPRKLTRTAQELEAETVSYLICKKLGLNSNSSEYIAGYIQTDEDLIQFDYEAVIKTADKIELLFVKEFTERKPSNDPWLLFKDLASELK